MKKRLLALALLLGLLTTGFGYGDRFFPTAKAENTGDSVLTQEGTEESSKDLTFADLKNREFYFASGAGGWRTLLYINADGSFSGAFSDSEMGSVGEGYPKGTYYLCEFEGRFTQPVQLNDYTYSMEIAGLRCVKEPDTTEIIDEIRYCYSTPYGLEGTEEVLIYLPGAPTDELPEAYMNWVRNDMAEPDAAELPFYGLYNIAEQNGFSSHDFFVSLDEYLVFIQEQASVLAASLENDPLTQAELNLKSQELAALWDAALNAVLSKLQGSLSEEELAVLTAEQQTWMEEKDKAVEEAGKEVQGGSIYPLIVNSEAARLTEERVFELYERLK
ncbi:MAG: DUF1311 domain-containing protein [Clostridia bacterium]|nr:DUF1311 domain-containing protein [Clostridia bacterium]